MEQEQINFGKFTLLVFPKNNMSFRIHKDVDNLNRSQKCILDNIWNARSNIQKFETLNALFFILNRLMII